MIDFAYRGATISIEHRQSAEHERAIVADIMNALEITNGPKPHHDISRGIFLLDLEHDPAALQALEVYAYAVSKAGDRSLCNHLIEKINEVRARKKA